MIYCECMNESLYWTVSSFRYGLSSILDLWGISLTRRMGTNMSADALDEESIRKDWIAVGDDIREATRTFERANRLADRYGARALLDHP